MIKNQKIIHKSSNIASKFNNSTSKIFFVSNPVYSGSALTSVTTSYTYDKLGRVTNKSINGSANSNTYTYDQMSRLVSMANSSSNSSGGLGSFNFNYENNLTNNSLGDRRLASINYPNSQIANFNYLPNVNDERLSNINNQAGSTSSIPNQILSNYSYNYDSSGEIVNSQAQNYKNQLNNYTYDNDGELTDAISNYSNNAPPVMNQEYHTYDKVFNKTSDQASCVEVLNIGGAPKANDVITVTMTGYGLNPNTITASYTVQSGNTLTTIAQNLAVAITNALGTSTFAWNYGIAAYPIDNSSSPNIAPIHIRSAANYQVTYSVSVTNSSGTPATIATLGNNANSNTLISISGITITPGDLLNIVVKDQGLSGGAVTASYTVASGDTTTSIATNLASTINNNSSLKTLGVTATSYNSVIVISSASTNATTYNVSSSNSTGTGYATESINFNLNQNATWQIVVSGTPTVGDIINAYVYDASLPNSVINVSHTVTSSDSLASIATTLVSGINSATNSYGISANNIDPSTKLATNVITLTSNSLNETSYVANGTPVSSNKATTESLLVTQNTNATQCVVIAGSNSGAGNIVSFLTNNSSITSGNYSSNQELVTYTTTSSDTLDTIAFNLATAINNDTNIKSFVSAVANENIVYITSTSAFNTTYTSYTNTGSSLMAVIPSNISANSYAFNNLNQITNIGGNVANSNNVTLQGSANTVITGTSTVASSMNIYSPNSRATTYSTSTTGANTEILTLSPNNAGNVNLSITGYPTSGDTVAVTVNTTSGQIPITANVTSNTEPIASIAASLVSGINSNATLQSLGITASNSGVNSNSTSNLKLNTNVNLSNNNGTSSNRTFTNVPNPLTTPATSNNYHYSYAINSLSPVKPSYDANGNMLSDGLNTYAYNAENQLVQINNSTTTSAFTYDANGRLVEIVDTNNSTGVTKTRQFIYCGNAMCEARDENNTLVTQYFSFGQISYTGSGSSLTGTNYYLTRDELNSVREVTDGNGNLITQYNYTSYGNVTANVGSSGQAPSVVSDFQYAGYYYHGSSGLNITLNRAYSSFLGRWLTRDPIGEAGGINLYGYVGGDPVRWTDPSGLDALGAIIYGGIGAGLGGIIFGGGGSIVGTFIEPGGGTLAGGFGGATGGAAIGGLVGSLIGSGVPVGQILERGVYKATGNDIYDQCVKDCKRRLCGYPLAIAWCIWERCRRLLGNH